MLRDKPECVSLAQKTNATSGHGIGVSLNDILAGQSLDSRLSKCCSKSFGLTDNDLMSLIPLDTMVGDRVYLLHDHDVLFVLRRVKPDDIDAESGYQCLGECNFHDHFCKERIAVPVKHDWQISPYSIYP